MNVLTKIQIEVWSSRKTRRCCVPYLLLSGQIKDQQKKCWWNQPGSPVQRFLTLFFQHGKGGGCSANRFISQPRENAFSFSQAGLLIELSWSVFPALYHSLVLVCVEGQFSGAYNVLLPKVCYNIEGLCVCVHGLHRHGCVILYWWIYHTETHTDSLLCP